MKNVLVTICLMVVVSLVFVSGCKEKTWQEKADKTWENFMAMNPTDQEVIYLIDYSLDYNSLGRRYYLEEKIKNYFEAKNYSKEQLLTVFGNMNYHTNRIAASLLAQKQGLTFQEIDGCFDSFDDETKKRFAKQFKEAFLKNEETGSPQKEKLERYLREVFHYGNPEDRDWAAEKLVHGNYDVRFDSVFFEILKEYPCFRQEIFNSLASAPMNRECWCFTFLMIQDPELATKIFCLRDISKLPYFFLEGISSSKSKNYEPGWGEYTIEGLGEIIPLSKQEVEKRKKAMKDPNELNLREPELTSFVKLFSDVLNEPEENRQKSADKIWEEFMKINPNAFEVCYLISKGHKSLDNVVYSGIDLTKNVRDYFQKKDYSAQWIYEVYYACSSEVIAKILVEKDGLATMQIQDIIWSLDEEEALRKIVAKKLKTSLVNEGYFNSPDKKGDLIECLKEIFRYGDMEDKEWAAERLAAEGSPLREDDMWELVKDYNPIREDAWKKWIATSPTQEALVHHLIFGAEDLELATRVLGLIDIPKLSYAQVEQLVYHTDNEQIGEIFKKELQRREKPKGEVKIRKDKVRVFIRSFLDILSNYSPDLFDKYQV